MLVNQKSEEIITTQNTQLSLSYTDLINLQMKVPNCSLMKEGYLNSVKLFYFCVCDPECQNPICETCLYECHGEHWKNKDFGEIIREESEGICNCGDNNHIIISGKNEKNNLLKEECMFMEWEEISKNYQYYKKIDDESILCPFCYECCATNKRQYTLENFYKSEVPKCSCTEHTEYTKTLEKFNILFSSDLLNSDETSLIKSIKTIFLAQNSFKNTFYNIEEVYKEIKKQKHGEDVDIEHYAYNSHLLKTFEKIDLMISKIKKLYYFDFNGLFSSFDLFDVIFNILRFKSGNNSRKIDLFKKYVLNIQHTMIFKRDFELIPSLSAKDIYNLNPFQRLMFCRYYKYFKNRFTFTSLDKVNIIDNLLETIEFFISEKNKNDIIYEILKIIYSELLIFIKLNQISYEQKIKFISINDELISSFIHNKDIDIKTKKYQFCILYKMIKCLLYISYNYNDSLVLSFLNNEIPLQKVNYFHCDNEMSKIIYRNVTQILYYCGLLDPLSINNADDLKNTIRTKFTTRISVFAEKNRIKYYNDQIMILASSITSLTLDFPDSYQEGLKRLKLFNKEFYLNYLNEQFENDERRMLAGILTKVEKLEALYQNYFNFNLKEDELLVEVLKVINEVFQLLEMKDYTPPAYRKGAKKILKLTDAIKLRRNHKKIEEERILLKKRQILLSKTTYLFSLLKSLNILSKYLEKYNINSKKKINSEINTESNEAINNKKFKNNQIGKTIINISDAFMEQLIKQLYLFCDRNLENCILILSKSIINNFKDLPLIYAEKILQFFYYILKIIRFHNITLDNISCLMSVFKNIISQIDKNSQAKYIKLYDILFSIIAKISKINYQNNELVLIKLRKFTKNIYSSSSILKNIKYYLLGLIDRDIPLKEIIQKDEKLEGCPIKSLIETYRAFLKIVNNIFNKSATINESSFLTDILTKLEAQKILIDLTLDLSFRIELIKFFLMAYINMKIDLNCIQDYINYIIENINLSSDMNSSDFNFFNELISVNEKSINMLNESYLLIYELSKFKKIIEGVNNRKKIYQYYENGIIIPLFVFINKYMAIIYNLNGKQYIKLYEIVLYFLQFKKYIVQDNLERQKNSRKQYEFSNLIMSVMNAKKNSFTILLENLNDSALAELNEDLIKIQGQDFEILNYRKVYSYFVKHAKTFIKKPESKFLKELFTKKSVIMGEEELQQKIKYEKINMYNGKLLQLITKYENDKVNIKEGSLTKNLSEKSLLYNATYRSILLRPMFHMINDRILFTKYRKQSLWHLFRLLQYDTNGTQEDILEIMKNEINEEIKLVNIHYLCELFFECYLSIVFSSVNPNSISSNDDYIIAYMVIKILKYFCEDHNTEFQTLFFKDIKIRYEDNPLNIFEMMMCALNKIVMLAQWDKVKFSQVEDNITYFYEIFFAMIEFSIEMIQGTKKSNLNEIISAPARENENSMFYIFMLEFKNIITNDDNDSEIVYNVRLDLLNFIVAFLEEKKTPEKLINLIANVFNPLTIFNSIVKTLIKLFIKDSGKGRVEDYKTNEFDVKKYKLFLKKYFEDPEFSQCNEFELANRMYNYVKLLTNFGNKDAKLLIDSINTYKENDIIEIFTKNIELKGKDDENVMIDQNFTQNYFAVKFFEEITRTVWIQGENRKPQASLFTLNPTVMFLSENTKNKFYMSVPRDSASSKLFSLMEYCNYFFIEINHNKKKFKGNFFMKILNKLDYSGLESYLFIITGIINIIIFLKADNDDQENGYEKIYNIVFYLGIIQIILNLLILFFWIISKYSLYYMIEKEKYYINNKLDKREETLSFLQKIKIGIVNTMLSKREIFGFIWNISFSSAAVSSKNNIYLFSIQLLIVINISTTLQNITMAVYMKYKQILLSISFLTICIYIFSVLAFYFLSKDYKHDLQGNIDENTCGSLMYCFLTHMNYGLRTDGGIGEFISKVSFLEEPNYFIGMFFFQLLFFIIIILLILAIICGTIIDIFAELLGKEQRDKNDKNNICFICNGEKNSIEKRGENFQEHITKVHNIWTYVDYLIGLKFVDPQETNAINSFVIEKVEEKKISWFPSFSNKEVPDEDENEEENEEEDILDSEFY